MHPVPAFKEDVAYRLAAVAALAFLCVGLVGAKADFPRAHLCDRGAYRFVCGRVYGKYVLSWADSEIEELSAVFGPFPGPLPFAFHRPSDGAFRCCHQCLGATLVAVAVQGRILRLSWLCGRLPRCPALRRVLGSIGTAPPIHVSGLLRVLARLPRGYTGLNGVRGFVSLGWRPGYR